MRRSPPAKLSNDYRARQQPQVAVNVSREKS